LRRTQIVAGAAVYAAMYVALTISLNPIGYGVLNFRVANALLGLVPIMGWAGILGQGLGVLIANQPGLGDPLGPLDLVNVIPSVAFAWLIWRLRGRSVVLGLTLYSVALGSSVSLVLAATGNLFFGKEPATGWTALAAGAAVFAGIFVVTVAGGYALYRAAGRLGVVQRRFGE
jgi:uncharacterized membrane protein